jgi:hypothetical protein
MMGLAPAVSNYLQRMWKMEIAIFKRYRLLMAVLLLAGKHLPSALNCFYDLF